MSKRIQVEVPDEVWDAIKAEAEEKDRTVTQQARRILRQWAKGEREPEQLKLPDELIPKPNVDKVFPPSPYVNPNPWPRTTVTWDDGYTTNVPPAEVEGQTSIDDEA